MVEGASSTTEGRREARQSSFELRAAADDSRAGFRETSNRGGETTLIIRHHPLIAGCIRLESGEALPDTWHSHQRPAGNDHSSRGGAAVVRNHARPNGEEAGGGLSGHAI